MDDFCVIHGYEHMRTRFGDPIPYCMECEKAASMGKEMRIAQKLTELVPLGQIFCSVCQSLDHECSCDPTVVERNRKFLCSQIAVELAALTASLDKAEAENERQRRLIADLRGALRGLYTQALKAIVHDHIAMERARAALEGSHD